MSEPTDENPFDALLRLVYVLKFGVPVHPANYEEFEQAECNKSPIGYTEVGEFKISTVFLSSPSPGFLNGDIIKLFFETAIFDDNDQARVIARYMSLPEAEEGHKSIVAEFIRLQESSFDTARGFLDRLASTHRSDST